jgi:hypothetical protein
MLDSIHLIGSFGYESKVTSASGHTDTHALEWSITSGDLRCTRHAYAESPTHKAYTPSVKALQHTPLQLSYSL